MTKSRSTLDGLNANRDDSIISAQHITKRFVTDKGADLTVLDDISFTLYDNEIVAILGRSGAGKSTFLRVLAGLVQPSEGNVDYRGDPLAGPNPGVALVFQTFALMPWLTVQANVELGLEARGMPRGQRRKVALAAIDSIGLDGFESAYPKELSGGMRQRVGIARALVLHPDALFMDEPFSALDVLTAENLRQEVLNLWSDKDHSIRSILMVTHNIEEAVEMADRVIVFGSHPGRIIAQVPVNLRRPRDRHSADFEARVDYLYSVMTGARQEEDDAANAAGESARTDSAVEAAGEPSARPRQKPSPSTAARPGAAKTDAEAVLLPTQPATEPPTASVTPENQQSGAEHAQGRQDDDRDASAIRGMGTAFADESDAPGTPAAPTAAAPASKPKPISNDQQFMPNATPGGLAGLLDVLAENPDGIDLADLAGLLSFEVDDLFPLIDAGMMLEVLNVHDGHAQLTKQGWEWHDADILGSKTVFARLALQHAPLVRTIDHALKQSKSGHLRGELILDLLRNRHEDAKARQQFHIAVTWGRYGELFDYDADDDMLVLDEENR
ncbi:ABC transporter ATP-binding protein [Bifidobacterium sp.]|uniref:ABC transporter ATP-binding protein n=1 Tax=Bifidobacterium sp. TaxID=41200 RepID=UPI0025C0CABA|nr:ATP-binding cassette domain-containing protein [Bifidobacterium sp.]MCH4208887.1 AAA-associated domain-containing protein [Bifidobacterium sp.]MCI1224434.1 AAA-associated domain-containing protein [Bifidobacterium sp.]